MGPRLGAQRLDLKDSQCPGALAWLDVGDGPVYGQDEIVIGAVTLVILAYTGVVAAPILGLGDFSLPGVSLYSPEAAAEWAARISVEKRLTSPATERCKDSRIAARTQDGEFLIVYLVVESQNKFGGTIRSYALALVKPGGGVGRDSTVPRLGISEQEPNASRIKELTLEMGEGWELEAWMRG